MRRKKRTRNIGLIRLLKLERELRRKPRSVVQLAAIFGVTPRTIWRDLDVLRAASVRIHTLSGHAFGFSSLFWIEERRVR